VPVTVRIRNVQSIRDATLRVEGFTVVTGPNNSGKTASQRAVRGVFTNASPGPLVRHGESHLTVDLTFGDGRTVKWEKGEKVNRYTVDGKVLSTVGRGAPAEVTALGVGEVKAGSDRLWPQIAEQFGGVLFLVDRPGSVVAEALSDVDKVGRFTEALRLAESDRRSVGAELKVRRADLLAAEQELAGFDALPAATLRVELAEQALADAESAGADLGVLHDLYARKQAANQEISHLSAAPVGVVPTPDEVSFVEGVCSRVLEASRLLGERTRYLREVERLTQASNAVVVPDAHSANNTMSEMGVLRGLFDRLASARAREEQAQRNHDGATRLVKVPSSEVFARVDKVKGILADMANYAARRNTARAELATATRELETVKKNLALLTEEVGTLLGDRGECPVCHTVCGTGAGGPRSPANG
jgi:energy-coupling factor transporter ATP-binding protein EcfA2